MRLVHQQSAEVVLVRGMEHSRQLICDYTYPAKPLSSISMHVETMSEQNCLIYVDWLVRGHSIGDYACLPRLLSLISTHIVL